MTIDCNEDAAAMQIFSYTIWLQMAAEYGGCSQ